MPSGAEFIRKVKSEIEEIDPSEVRPLARQRRGDRRRPRESRSSPPATCPAPSTSRARYLERGSRAPRPTASSASSSTARRATAPRSAARTMLDDLGYEDVVSMTGGYTLWKDRGYDVEVPRVADRRAARPLQPPPARPRGRPRGPDQAARREGALPRRRRPRLADRALPGRGGRRHAGHRRRRRRRPLQPPAPGHPHHRPASGTPKVDSAEEAVKGLNPDVNVVKYQTRLDASNIMEIIEGYDVIVDGVDNFPTRYLLNDASVRLNIPVVSAAILGFEGQLQRLRALRRPVLPLPVPGPAAGRARARAAAPTACSACCPARWACCRPPRSSS